jgi:hypothetical protein
MSATATFFAAATVIASAAISAMAQNSNVINVLGTVERIDATSISLKDDESGVVESFKLAPNVLVVQNKTATLADVNPNDFVASAAVRGVDGKLHSTELRIFPEAMRGVGEGQRPMNDARNQTMTNATVTGAVVVNGSNNIRVKFNGGESDLILDPGVPVIRIDTVDIGLVRSGMKVRVRGVRSSDGASVNRITVQ